MTNSTSISLFPPPGSPAREHSGSQQRELADTMRRTDYLPVAGEEKNPGADFVNTDGRNNESIVRLYVDVVIIRICVLLPRGKLTFFKLFKGYTDL